MIAFIDDHRGTYGVKPICKVPPIASSTYHAHAVQRADPAKASPRVRRDVALMAQIRRVHAENFDVYGAREVWRLLGREGVVVARCTVERLMRCMGLRRVVSGKVTRTTIAETVTGLFKTEVIPRRDPWRSLEGIKNDEARYYSQLEPAVPAA